MKDMNVPTFNAIPWCVQGAVSEMDIFELTSSVVHHLPKFAGMEGESLRKQLVDAQPRVTSTDTIAKGEVNTIGGYNG